MILVLEQRSALLSLSFDRIAGIYDRTRGLPDVIMKTVLKVLVRELKDCRSVFDVGVGTGRFAKPLQDLGFKVAGIDVSAKMLKEAAEKGTENLLLGDICCLPFRDLSFDATLSTHVLHLIKEWKTALREIARVTRHILISSTCIAPNPLMEAYRRLLEERGYVFPERGIAEAQLKNLIKPSKSVVTVSGIAVEADKTLSMFEKRGASSQLQVPDHLHRRVMKKLEERFSGKTYYRDIEILVWDTTELKAFLEDDQSVRA